MIKSGSDDATPAGEPEHTIYAHREENTKYAKDSADHTKYASLEENTKYAAVADNTKYAAAEDNTKYAAVEDNTKYAAAADHTKYAGGGSPTASHAPLLRRRAVDSAIEEALMSATAAVDRIHPGISAEARARLVGTLIDKFGSELLEAHLGVTREHHR